MKIAVVWVDKFDHRRRLSGRLVPDELVLFLDCLTRIASKKVMPMLMNNQQEQRGTLKNTEHWGPHSFPRHFVAVLLDFGAVPQKRYYKDH